MSYISKKVHPTTSKITSLTEKCGTMYSHNDSLKSTVTKCNSLFFIFDRTISHLKPTNNCVQIAILSEHIPNETGGRDCRCRPRIVHQTKSRRPGCLHTLYNSDRHK